MQKTPSLLPEMVGIRSKSLIVISPIVHRRGIKNEPYLETRCERCNLIAIKCYHALKKNLAGCRKCNMQVPEWLRKRCNMAKQRCTSPNDRMYSRYGGRGIEFRFESPLAMAKWIMNNTWWSQELEIDRIDNNGHYEAGNLRMVNKEVNLHNRRFDK